MLYPDAFPRPARARAAQRRLAGPRGRRGAGRAARPRAALPAPPRRGRARGTRSGCRDRAAVAVRWPDPTTPTRWPPWSATPRRRRLVAGRSSPRASRAGSRPRSTSWPPRTTQRRRLRRGQHRRRPRRAPADRGGGDPPSYRPRLRPARRGSSTRPLTRHADRLLLEVREDNHVALRLLRRPRLRRDRPAAALLRRRHHRGDPVQGDRMSDEPLVLGIETSCDETGVGIVRGHTLLADAVASSVEEHARFGGVVPEVASRAHLEAMVPTIERACETAGIRLARRRRDRGDQRPRPRRRAAGRRRRGQGAGDRARQADLRRQPPRRPRRRRPARARAAARARAWRCSSAAATPACCASPT